MDGAEAAMVYALPAIHGLPAALVGLPDSESAYCSNGCHVERPVEFADGIRALLADLEELKAHTRAH